MNTRHKAKGITIVSLVITIILLLILAGISIQAMTNTGLFEGAFQAKREAKRGQITEWLSMKLVEEQAITDISKTAEQIIEATRQNVIEHQEELKTMGKDVTIEETKTEEDFKEVDIYFYVIVDNDVYKVELKGVTFIGEIGTFSPVIKLESITETTSSITVQVATLKNEGGKLEYYIKKEGETDYTLADTKEDTETRYTYIGLEQNKNYSLKIVAVAPNSKTAEVIADKKLGSVPDLVVGDITFTYTVDGIEINKNTWTNKNVTVTANTDEKGFTLQTSKDAQTWNNVRNQIFADNGQIYVRLWDGTNAGGAASANVTNIDTLAPQTFTPTATSTTKSVTVTASTEDADATDASGKSEIAGYRFRLDNGEWTGYQTNGTYTWDNLAQTTNHTITVEAKDNAGNTTQATTTKGTGTIIQAETASYTPTEWTNGNVTVTLPIKEGFTTRYTTNGTAPTKTSTQYNGPFTVSSNCVITYIYTDGTNIGGANTANITNIDTAAPTVPTITYNSGSNECRWENNINITLSSSDSQSGVAYYEIDWNSDGIADTTTGSHFVPWNGYSSCGTRFRAVDNVGNRSGWTESVHIHMDTEKPTTPTITYNSGSNQCIWENNINITLSSTDGVSGVSYYQIDWNGDGVPDANIGSNCIPRKWT